MSDLAAVPALVGRFASECGAAIWDFPVSDKVASPVIRRAHPQGFEDVERTIVLPNAG